MALKQLLTNWKSPIGPLDIKGEVQAQLQPEDALAYCMWATMSRSQGAYQQRYHAEEMSATTRETVDRLPWDEGLHQRGATFVYRGVKFLTEEGIMRWVVAHGNHILVNAVPSGDCGSARP